MLKRILIAMALTFSAVQAAQACNTCGCRDKKKADEAKHDHDHGAEGHSHDTDGADAGKTDVAKADVAKPVALKTSGTFTKAKKKIQFTAADGKVYTLNKKMLEKVTPLLDQKVDLVAKVKTDAKTGKSVITSIKKIKPAKS